MSSILAALVERSRSGRGQVVEVAMTDAAALLATMIYGMHAHDTWKDRRASNLLDGGAPFYDTYRTRDDRHMAVGAIESQFFARLLEGLGLPLDTFDQWNQDDWPRMRKTFASVFATDDRDEWARRFEEVDACVTPVLALSEAPVHPHNQMRGVFTPLAGGYQPTLAPRFSRTPALEPGPVRKAGQDSRAILLDVGFSAPEIEAFLASGVVHASD